MIRKLSIYDIIGNIYVAPSVHMRDNLPVFDANNLRRYDCLVCNLGFSITNKDFRDHIDSMVDMFEKEEANTAIVDLNQYKTMKEMNQALFDDCVKKNLGSPCEAFHRFITVQMYRKKKNLVMRKFDIETDGFYIPKEVNLAYLDYKFFGYFTKNRFTI